MKDHDQSEKLPGWLKRPPLNVRDPRAARDPYWRMRMSGYSHSFARRVLRGEAIVTIQPDQSNSEVHEQFCFTDVIHETDFTELNNTQQPNHLRIAIRPDVLTQDVVDTAPALGYEYSIADRKVSGLSLRIRASGHKSYVFYFRIGRKNKKIRIASASDVTLVRARDITREFHAILALGGDPRTETFHSIKNEKKRSERRSARRKNEKISKTALQNTRDSERKMNEEHAIMLDETIVI